MTKNVSTSRYAGWVADFVAERDRRVVVGDPAWTRGARLPRALIRSIQRFQVGEDGDGAGLRAKAGRAGDPGYAEAVGLFVAEEQNHARMLALLLSAAGARTLSGHWSDAVFVRLRRLLGLRLELLVLMVAEVVALRYYRALRTVAATRWRRRWPGASCRMRSAMSPFTASACAKASPGSARGLAAW